MTTRINARLSGPLAAYVDRMVGANGLYETPSEYIRDLIRRDMERRTAHTEQDAILEGYQDLAASRIFASSGNFETDMKTLAEKEANGWS
ncbi:MAG: CopG family transcriptional regulator [Pseudomonadota bacterium]